MPDHGAARCDKLQASRLAPEARVPGASPGKPLGRHPSFLSHGLPDLPERLAALQRLEFYPYYPERFESSTTHFTAEQVGVYQRLLNWQWLNGPLPDDPEQLAMIARCTGDFEKVWAVVGRKFKPDGNGDLLNGTLEEHRADAEGRYERRAAAARKRWDTTSSTTTTKKEKEQLHSGAHALQEQCTSNAWEVGWHKIPKEVDTKEVRAALQAWLDYRKSARLKIYKASLWISLAAKDCDMDPAAMIEAVEHSLAREYQGIYRPGAKSGNGKPSDHSRRALPDDERLEAFRRIERKSLGDG